MGVGQQVMNSHFLLMGEQRCKNVIDKANVHRQGQKTEEMVACWGVKGKILKGIDVEKKEKKKEKFKKQEGRKKV